MDLKEARNRIVARRDFARHHRPSHPACISSVNADIEADTLAIDALEAVDLCPKTRKRVLKGGKR